MPEDKLGPNPNVAFLEEDHAKNNLPDVVARWAQRDGGELTRPRTSQSFCVSKADVAANGYALNLNTYTETVHDLTEHDPPKKIIAELAVIEREIQDGLRQLQGGLE